ncbi:MAG: site-specific DNA-methyltransferase [Chloroflexi bacterium]|nr:site-specific DNA-methyltransferase [Chloroflexota bacterium]
MAAIDDLIAQIEDKALRTRLKEEADRLRREKKFGLVFEEHLPELTPVYSAEVRPGCLAARRGAALTDIWRVLAVEDGQSRCLNRASGVHESFPTADLVVVLEFGDPIFPSLVPMERVQNGPDDAPWHTLIEADNYHALQLLEYLYAGQMDCIYIDPPYNTGARDWKYNNDYVDENDQWRHSKWLAFMKRRLVLAKRLLNPDNSVLIVTVDEKEYLRLGLLLEDVFIGCSIKMVSTMINPANVARAGAFGRNDEYIFFVTVGAAAPQRIKLNREWVSDKGRTHTGNIRWDLLRRSGTNTSRNHSPGCFYPIYINPDGPRIEEVGDPLPREQSNPDGLPGLIPVLPIRRDGSEGNWQWAPQTFRDRQKQGRVRITGSANNGYVVSILKDGEYAKIERGEFQEIGRNPDGSIVVADVDTQFVLAVPGSQWKISSHDATQYGSRLLGDILPGRKFPFPKSVYAVRDTIRFFVDNKPDAQVVDFFSGSGTTLNAVNLLNATDGGRRRCIMVTNNEVSEDEALNLRRQHIQPGQPEWEQHGICQSITWPRSKYTILGRRDDGTELAGEYLTGRTVTKEKPRTYRQLSFIDPATLTTTARKRELVSLIGAIPAGEIKGDTAWFVSPEARYTAAILFDTTQGDAFLEALEGMDHVTHFYIVTQKNRRFVELKAQIEDLLGPIEAQEEEKRPMRDGFPTNLEYFKLDFLDKDHVALGRQFHEILPLLWLRAGAVGVRPELPADAPIPAMLIPATNPFAVLVDETRFADFLAAIRDRSDLTHLFLITDSEDAFREMAAQLAAPHVIQLYRDYLENFMINRGEMA